jgi:hypothetical protein
MNLHQFRVLGAVLRLSDRFTTLDLVREAGVSAEVVRKTYQRYEQFFTVVTATKQKVRSLTPPGPEEILKELRQSQSLLPPPPARNPEGEPLGLAGAERVLYELIPASNANGRALLLREARLHLELAEQEREMTDEPPLSVAVEVRLDAVRRMLDCVEVLHGAKSLLEKPAPDTNLASIEVLSTALINSSAAQQFSQLKSESLRAGLLDLLDLRASASEETDRIASALLALAKEPAWCKGLGIPGAFWTAQEETLLETRFRDGAPIGASRIDEPFTICVDHWKEAEHGDAPVRATLALLRIAFRDKIATRHLDPWSRSVQDSARLAAYPLALWLASSWWRLRWEPVPSGAPGQSWRRAHDISTMGYGLVWPPLTLASNGERVFGRCRPTASASTEDSLRYLESFDESVPAADFERTAENFIEQVLDRAGVGGAELASVWQKLTAERSDLVLSNYRRFEAMLGFNRDEAPKQALQYL